MIGALWLLPAAGQAIAKRNCEVDLVEFVEGRDGILWTRELILKKVRKLARSRDPKFRMNRSEIEKQRSQEVKTLVGIAGSYLVELATKLVAPLWDDVLRAAEVNVLEARVSLFLTPEQFKKAIQILHRRGVVITAGVLQRDLSASTSRVLKREFGAGITGAQVYYAGYKHYGDWRSALQAANLPVEAIQRYHYWTKEEMIEIVQTLYQNGVALNALALFSIEFRYGLWKHLKIRQSGEAFYRTAIARCGSWDNFLREAELDPLKIRKYLWRIGNLSTERFQWEPMADGRGDVQWQRLLGRSAISAHEAVVEKEAAEEIQATLLKLPPSQRQLGEWVLDEIFGSNDLNDAGTIAAALTRQSQRRVTRKQVEAILEVFESLAL